MRGNPQFSVPIYGSAAPGYAVSRASLPTTIDSMASIPNPVPADARSLLNGRKNYTINCAVCHGYEGKGDGPIVAKGFPPIPLVGPASPAPGRTDGYIWGMMRNGRGLMPSYNRIEELDRWDVVNYLRGLQGRYAVQIGPVGLPGETGDKVPGYSQTGPTRPSPYYVHAGSQAGPPGASAGQRADSAARPAADSAGARRDSSTSPSTATPRGAAPTQPTMTPPPGGPR
jgi:mono/diheme cytochrome c family protein